MTDSPFAALSPKLAEALTGRGFTQLTAIQARVLEPGLADRDLRIASQTGSGKTVAVGFVIAQLIEGSKDAGSPIAVLIAPTRELAAQLQKELSWLVAPLGAKVAVVAGGASYRDELRALKQQPKIIVGTPGRLLDHLDKGSIGTSAVKVVVLDEADQMLDLGFRDELEAILAKMPEERRTHLVSATFSRDVLRLAERFQSDAVLVEGTSLGEANSDIEHIAHVVRPGDKEAALINLLLMAPDERALLFVRTRAGASDLAELLSEAGFPAMPLSGELEQKDRNKTLAAFKSGTVRTLVATDVAARGLDIPEVARVIHVEPPTDGEGFTHRSGRTGRAGKKGQSIVLVPPMAKERVRMVMKRAGVNAAWLPVPVAADIERAADERLVEQLTTTAANPRLADLAARLVASGDPAEVIAKLLAHAGHEGPTEARPISPWLDRPRNDRRDDRSQDRGRDRDRHDDRWPARRDDRRDGPAQDRGADRRDLRADARSQDRRDGRAQDLREDRRDERSERPALRLVPPPSVPVTAPLAVEASPVEAVRVEAPRFEAPHTDAPRVEAPRAEAPRAEAPQVAASPVIEGAPERKLTRAERRAIQFGHELKPKAPKLPPPVEAQRDEQPRQDARPARREDRFVPFRINFGERDGADARNLLAMVCRRGRITGDQVGAIRVYGDDSTFEVSSQVAADFARASQRPDPRNPDVQIDAVEDRRKPAYGSKKPAYAPKARAQGNDGGWSAPRVNRGRNSHRAD